MAQAVFIGPRQSFGFAGLTFQQGEPRPVPDAAVEFLASHPWFEILDAEPQPRRRGRPRKEG